MFLFGALFAQPCNKLGERSTGIKIRPPSDILLCVQLTGAKDPAALEKLVKATGVKAENVNR